MEEKNAETADKSTKLSDEVAALVGLNGENTKFVLCKFCKSKVLRPGAGQYVKEEFFLPKFDSKQGANNSSTVDGEKLEDFWHVKDMFHFENVGFSKKVGNVQYLTCADCEIGPIGWHDKMDRTRSYVALSRVDYQ